MSYIVTTDRIRNQHTGQLRALCGVASVHRSLQAAMRKAAELRGVMLPVRSHHGSRMPKRGDMMELIACDGVACAPAEGAR